MEREKNAPKEAWDREVHVSFMRQKCVRKMSPTAEQFCKRTANGIPRRLVKGDRSMISLSLSLRCFGE
jgi:hypothetical protein